jgi:hypothetical protein
MAKPSHTELTEVHMVLTEALPKVDTLPPTLNLLSTRTGTIILMIQGPVGTRIRIFTAMSTPQCRRHTAQRRTTPPKRHPIS